MMVIIDDDRDDDDDERRLFMFFIYDSKVPLDPIGDAEGPYLYVFYIRFKSPVGDAEDAR